MSTADHILEKITVALDHLVECGKKHHGLFPSVLELDTIRMPDKLPPAIDGQRECDRSFPGCNLMHDHPTLKVMYGLAQALGRKDYEEAADRYLERFAIHCTNTPTGLFPWGEHAFWNLIEDRPENSYTLARSAAALTHDHLHQAPEWLWEKMWHFNPQAVERFCRALDGHFLVGEPLEYIRHADILHTARRTTRGPRSCDFPRHSGFYIFDWSFAFAKTGADEYAERIWRALDYWWTKRNNLNQLKSESRSPESDAGHYKTISLGQTISLAISLLEASFLVEERSAELAASLKERGTAYVIGFISAPHDLANGRFVNSLHEDTGEVKNYSRNWGSRYGSGAAVGNAVLCLCAYRIMGDTRLRTLAESVGLYNTTHDIPKDVNVPAKDAGATLEVLADLYDITGEKEWLKRGLSLAETVLDIYFDHQLPRGASGIEIYESQLLPSYFLHGLSRLALLSKDKGRCILGPDYTLR